MQTNAITHFLCAVLPLLVVGCGSNAPQQNTAKETNRGSDEISETATSWHCEQGLQTWSCKRRSIADIQRREAERKNKRFDWSQPQPTTPTGTGETLFELAPADVPAMEPPTAALDSRTGEGEASSRSEAPVSLKDLPGDYWAVQLIALSTQGELKTFMAETNLDELTGAMIEVKGRTYYVALLGVYETRAAAELAARNRPTALKRLEPYIRSMASLQSAMNRADSL